MRLLLCLILCTPLYAHYERVVIEREPFVVTLSDGTVWESILREEIYCSPGDPIYFLRSWQRGYELVNLAHLCSYDIELLPSFHPMDPAWTDSVRLVSTGKLPRISAIDEGRLLLSDRSIWSVGLLSWKPGDPLLVVSESGGYCLYNTARGVSWWRDDYTYAEMIEPPEG